jgi:hypothetical protein
MSTTGKRLVLEADILIRAALGNRARFLLDTYEDSTDFYVPDVCFEDAHESGTELRQFCSRSASTSD